MVAQGRWIWIRRRNEEIMPHAEHCIDEKKKSNRMFLERKREHNLKQKYKLLCLLFALKRFLNHQTCEEKKYNKKHAHFYCADFKRCNKWWSDDFSFFVRLRQNGRRFSALRVCVENASETVFWGILLLLIAFCVCVVCHWEWCILLYDGPSAMWRSRMTSMQMHNSLWKQ